MDEKKNMIVATVLSFAVIMVWFILFPPKPPQEAPQPQSQVEQPLAQGGATEGAAPSAAPAASGGAPAGQAAAPVSRDAALQRAPRAPILTDRLRGSVSLIGGRIDDLHLSDFKETLDPDSDTVTLLSPVGAEHPFYAVYGWLSTRENPVATPGPNTEWTLARGQTLTTDTPLTLTWDNGAGLLFKRVISVDDHFMFSIDQSVVNNSAATVDLAPYGYVSRMGEPETVNFYIIHEGAVGVFDGTLTELGYDDMQELEGDGGPGVLQSKIQVADSGWLGFTDKYWMATIAPAPGQQFEAVFKYLRGRGQSPQEYRAEARLPMMSVAPGGEAVMETRMFAGAKEYDILKSYEDEGIQNFTDAIDWGWFFFLTKPIFQLLVFLKGFIGNMGFSIIALTLIIKAALFPLAYKSYVSMSKMKKLQPEMEKLKERCGDDKQKLQQEMMALYKREKANPAAGCLPILLQIPIFFSLYKVLFVTIEMRQAPFIGWIRDLSAPDPSSILNFFGLAPWGVPEADSIFAIVSLGLLPILLGISMWLQQKLNPAPTDATQAMIFAWMPWVFMFMLGRFASGLVVYWIANNTITFTQQYIIMRSQGVDVDLLGNVTRTFKRKKKSG